MKASEPFRLIAVDLDGTLLDSQQRVPERNRAALHAVHQAGLKVVLCTGRSFTETRPVLEQIGLDLDAAVTVGGALISDAVSGRTLERTVIPRPAARQAVDWFRRRGHTVLWLHDREQAGFDGYAIAGPRRHPAVEEWLQRAPVQVRVVLEPPDGGVLPLRVTIVDEREALHALASEFVAAFGGRLTHNVIDVSAYRFTVIEAFAAPVSKWYGIERLCQRWSIDPRATVAIGDDVNDACMLENAGLGVAMAKAPPEIRAAADQTTASNDACGVAAVIERLLES